MEGTKPTTEPWKKWINTCDPDIAPLIELIQQQQDEIAELDKHNETMFNQRTALEKQLTIATDALKQYSERDNWSESLDSMPGVNNNTLQLEDIWGGNSSHGWSVATLAIQQIKDQS